MGCATLLYGPAGIAATIYAMVQAHYRFGLAWLPAYLIATNIVTFAFYAYDKVFVDLLKLLHLRVPKKVLVWWFAFPGGILGAVIAMILLHHKTGPDSRDFRVELLAAYAIQMTLVLVVLLISLLLMLADESWYRGFRALAIFLVS